MLKKLLIILSISILAYFSNKPCIHLYLDKASSPTLLQMVDFIKQPSKDYKIARWNRINDYIPEDEKNKNTFFSLDIYEIQKKISDIVKEDPDIKIIIHYNTHHFYDFDFFYNEFQKNVKEVHLYEDASGYFFREKIFIFNQFDKLKGVKKIFHLWGDEKKLCSDDKNSYACSTLDFIKINTKISPVNFEQLEKLLSEQDKIRIFKFNGLDYQYYKELFSSKKIGVYILAAPLYSQLLNAQLTALKDACDSTKNENYTWFYKYHPSRYARPTHTVLNKLCPEIQSLDSHIPYELLIIGGLKPDKIAGFASSLFFNQNRDDILYYIQRDNNDVYLKTLKQSGLVDEQNLYNMNTVKAKLIELQLFQILGSDYRDYYLKMDDNTACNTFKNECINILDETKDEKTIKYSNGIIKKIKKNNKNAWEWFEINE